MNASFPIKVILRCRDIVTIRSTVRGLGSFALFGTQRDGTTELWRKDGKWREDGAPHPSDIVGVDNGDAFEPLTDQFKKAA